MDIQKGLNLSEAVMIELTKRGVNRQEAHELLRRASMRAYENKTTLLDELLKEEIIMKYFTKEELKNLLKPENYLGTARKKIENVVQWIKELINQ